MQAPFATACVLAYNRPRFLQQMLATMTAFAGHPLEIIVHDDGSTDAEQRSWLNHMVDQGRISTLIANPPGHNQGQGHALNRMFRMAKGDPIIKLDHDLIFKEGWLRKVVDILERDGARPVWECMGEGRLPRIGCLGMFKYHADPVHHEKMHLVSGEDWDLVKDFVGSAIAVPRGVWEDLRPFEEHSPAFAEDYDFKMRAQKNGYGLALTKEDLVENQGFGVGPSTLVVDHDHNLAQIHTEPHIIYPNGASA